MQNHDKRSVTDDFETVLGMETPDDRADVELSQIPSVDPAVVKVKKKAPDLLYNIHDKPGILQCLIFGLQQSIICITGTMSMPLIITTLICADDNLDLRAELFSTTIFVCGVTTLLQCTVGVRLPIIQGGSHSFAAPLIAFLTLDSYTCPSSSASAITIMNGTTAAYNISNNSSLSFDMQDKLSKLRLTEILGSLMVASSVQIVLGATGLMGFLLRFIGPLTVMPTVTMIGLAMFEVCAKYGSQHWGVWALSCGILLICGVYLRDVSVPFPWWNREEGWHKIESRIFVLIPVLLSVCISWITSYILTVYDMLPNDKNELGFYARTDARWAAVETGKWAMFPYPGQFGMPQFKLGAFVGLLSATIASVIESVGDYHAAARICGVPPPPSHAVNRGILTEGLGSLLAGVLGAGHGTTSYSNCIGIIGITKVGSMRVFITAGLLMIGLGLFGKFGAVLAAIPDPVQGGILTVGMGMVASVGLANLQFIDATSSRNMAILGFSLLTGLTVPEWMKAHKGAVATGNYELDQLLSVFLTTPMFLSGVIGFVMDNTVPGTLEERGILKWKEKYSVEADDSMGGSKFDLQDEIYDIPYVTNCLRQVKVLRYFPFLPCFNARICQCPCKGLSKRRNTITDTKASKQNGDVELMTHI